MRVCSLTISASDIDRKTPFNQAGAAGAARERGQRSSDEAVAGEDRTEQGILISCEVTRVRVAIPSQNPLLGMQQQQHQRVHEGNVPPGSLERQ